MACVMGYFNKLVSLILVADYNVGQHISFLKLFHYFWWVVRTNRGYVNKVHNLCMNNSAFRQYLNKIRQLTQNLLEKRQRIFCDYNYNAFDFFSLFFSVPSRCVQYMHPHTNMHDYRELDGIAHKDTTNPQIFHLSAVGRNCCMWITAHHI